MGDKMDIIEIFLKALGNSVNFTIIVIILLLAIIDLIFKKDLKSQIVSLGVWEHLLVSLWDFKILILII